MSQRSFLVVGFWQNGEPYSVGVIENPPGESLDVIGGGDYMGTDDAPRGYEGPWAVTVEAIDPDAAEYVAREQMREENE